MTAPSRLQARPMPPSLVEPDAGEISQPAPEQPVDDVDGVPVAAGLVILMIGVVLAFAAYGIWLGSAQCIKIGGCA